MSPTARGTVLDFIQHPSQLSYLRTSENTKRWTNIQSTCELTYTSLRTYLVVVLHGQVGFPHVEIGFGAFFITLCERE